MVERLGVHFSHYECFGHTSRVMAIGEVFKKRFPRGDLFFIQSGVIQPRSKIDQMAKVYTLPGNFINRHSFKKSIRISGPQIDERSRFCENILTKERPDLFMTEFFPLGREECRYELIPSLIRASKQGTKLWAAAGYPLLTGTNFDWREKVLELYQKVIIFSPALEKDFIAHSLTQHKQKYLDFFKRHSKKIIFAGYLLPQQQVTGDHEDKDLPKPPKGACRVTVVRGGGAYYPKVIAEAIRASDSLGSEYYFTVVAGPSTIPEEWDLFNTLVAKKKVNNLVLLRTVGDYEGLIKASDVCVSTAPYHTSVILLKHRKRAVIIPFEGYGPMSHVEQPARAAMLKEAISAGVLPFDQLTAKTLAKFIKKASSRQIASSDIFQEWFTGADTLDKQLKELFSP